MILAPEARCTIIPFFHPLSSSTTNERFTTYCLLKRLNDILRLKVLRETKEMHAKNLMFSAHGVFQRSKMHRNGDHCMNPFSDTLRYPHMRLVMVHS